MSHVDIGAVETENGWKGLLRTVGHDGQIDEFEKDGYPTKEAAIEEIRGLVYGWMLKTGLTGRSIDLTQACDAKTIGNESDG